MIEIRNDDILQATMFSRTQKKAVEIKSLFDYFLEIDKYFEKYNYPCTLAIISEGIDKYPEWVEHIKKNIHRYKIELHGYSHNHFAQLPEEVGEKELRKALDIIEKTFNTKITTWYVPFGRKSIPEWGGAVCERLGIKLDIPVRKTLPIFWFKDKTIPQVNFHYWEVSQVNLIKEIIKLCRNTKLG